MSVASPVARAVVQPVASSVVGDVAGGSSGPGANDVVSNGEAVLSNTEQVTST